MPFSEKLEGEVGVSDYRAALLLDRLADYAGALDVSGLSVRDSEDLRNALDAIYVAGLCGCVGLPSHDGFLYGLVDDLSELCHGEVDESCVLSNHVFLMFCLFLRPEKGSNLRRPRLAWSLSLSRGSAY